MSQEGSDSDGKSLSFLWDKRLQAWGEWIDVNGFVNETVRNGADRFDTA